MFGTRPSERATMARGLAMLFGAGASLVLLTLALPHDANTDDLGVAVPPILAYGVVGLLVTAGRRFSPGALGAVLALGTILITGCIVFGGDSASAYALMYVWVALYAGYFFAPLTALAHVALCGACYAAAFALQDHIAVPQAHWVMAVGTAAVAAALIGPLVRHVRAQAADLEAVADLANGAVHPERYGAQICDGLLASTGADVVALVEPEPDGRGVRPLAAAGRGGSPHLAEGLLGGLELARRSGAPIVLHGQGSRRRIVGLAQPVLRDGEAVAVLLLAWHRPRRHLPQRAESAAAVFAGQAGVAMERLARLSREKERQALEINDNIVQGLAVAKYALAGGDAAEAGRAIDETLASARRLVTDQLDDVARAGGEIAAGDLVREAPGRLREPPAAI